MPLTEGTGPRHTKRDPDSVTPPRDRLCPVPTRQRIITEEEITGPEPVFNLYYITYTVGVDSPNQPSESQYWSPCWPLWGWLIAECWPILLWQCPTWLPHTWPACLGRRDWWERRSPGEKEQSGSIRMCCSHLIRTVSGIFFWTPWGQKNSEHSSSIYGVTWG